MTSIGPKPHIKLALIPRTAESLRNYLIFTIFQIQYGFRFRTSVRGGGYVMASELTSQSGEHAATRDLQAAEREKWDAYYSKLDFVEEDAITKEFNAELVAHISRLLPGGGRSLEAGSGGGWQSLALARTGRFATTILDFSAEALSYSRRVFEREALPVEFIHSEIEAPGGADFDIVFNAGVLEHYTVERQISLVRGMTGRSRRFVMALVPNRDCYWYWVWRLNRSSQGDWPWGKEVPATGMRDVFEASGLKFLGHAYLGQKWTESFMNELTDKTPELRELLLSIHRAPLLPARHNAYMVAVLGSIGAEDAPVGWHLTGDDRPEYDNVSAALADALAALNRGAFELRISRENNGRQDSPGVARLVPCQEERETALQEKRSMIRVLDAISGQASALQVERRELAGRMEEVQAEATGLRLEKQSLLAETRGLSETVRTLEGRLTSQQERHTQQIAGFQGRCESLFEETLRAQSMLKSADEALIALRLTVERKAADEWKSTGQSSRAEIRDSEENAQPQRLIAFESGLAEKERQIVAERARSEEALRRYDTIKRGVVNAGINFESTMQSLLNGLRVQRAWHVMLAIRKAYTLWTRHGFSGKLRSLKVPLELLTASQATFPEYDPRFPSIWDYWSDADGKPDDSSVHKPVRSTPGKLDIIIFPVFDFEFRFQRPQQIAAHLARAGHRVFWLSPSRFLGSDSSRRFETILLRENLYEVRISGPEFRIYTDSLPAERAREIANAVVDLYRMADLGETAILVQFPFWRQVALEVRKQVDARIVYDCMDDWRNWTAEPRISDFSLQEERALAQECDVLVATSAELHSRLETESGRSALRLRNGVDFEFFQTSKENLLLQSTAKPIVGYYGAIADWVDVELMTNLAEMRPRYSFVIIGEVHGIDVSRLAGLPNVQLLGEKHYHLIPSYLRNFDACLFPFMQSNLTKAVDPVKVYEYLSQGKPVIATPLPEVRDHGNLVYLAETVGEFASQLDRALVEPGGDAPARRIAYAELNSWRRRTDCLADAIADSYSLVSILAVSYNSREYLAPFLDSVRRNTAYPRYELIVVDNNSTDGSQDLLQAYETTFPQLHTILLNDNKGFAAGNNVAAAHAQGEFLVLLNVDTVVTWGWLSRLLRPLKSDAEIGMAAPATNFSGNETRIRSGYRTLSQMEQFARERASAEFHQTLELEMVPLLCAALPRRVWSAVGELDEGFGVGMFEDDDYCVRVRDAGYKIVAVEDCFIHHFGNGSFGKIPSDAALKLFEKNRSYFEAKWKKTWTRHKMREGVPPLSERSRIPLSEFLAAAEEQRHQSPRLVLSRLLPPVTAIGQPINPQPSGDSALVVECENATPGTVVRFNGELLQTSYGHAGLLSAVLPDGFNRIPGVVPVSLINDLGESDILVFRVET